MHGSGQDGSSFRLAGALRRLVPALLLLAALPAAARAHTRLESSFPTADAVLRESPAELRLRFSAAVEPRLTGAALVTPAGDTVPLGPAVPEPGSGGRGYVLAVAEPLAPGQYMVEWRTAGADGHVIRGGFSFLVEGLARPPATVPPVDTAAAPGAAPPSDPAEDGEAIFLSGSPLSVLVRWLGFLGLLGMVGAAASRLAVLPRARNGGLPADTAGAVAARLHRAALAAVALFALGLAGRLWLQAAALSGAGGAGAEAVVGVILDTGWGRAWTAQAAGAAVFLAGLLLFRGREGATGWRVAAAALAMVAAGTAYSGHAAATERARAAALLADGLHVLGAGAWMGALGLLLGVGIPAALRAPGGGGRGAAVAALVRAFSPVALLGAGTAAATGVVSALFHLGAPADLWATAYGRALLVKLALVALAAAGGFRSWRVLTPRLEEDADARALRRTVAAEVAAGVLVVLATAVLVALPTP